MFWKRLERTEKKAFEMIREKPDNLRYIENQTEKICLEALHQQNDSYDFIKSPTQEMELFYNLNRI